MAEMARIVEEKTVQVKWSRNQYSEVSRSDIIEPSPIRPGQKVTVIWGKQKKEHTAVVDCYPVEPIDSQLTEPQDDQQLPRARVKRKLVSNCFSVINVCKFSPKILQPQISPHGEFIVCELNPNFTISWLSDARRDYFMIFYGSFSFILYQHFISVKGLYSHSKHRLCNFIE